MILNKARTYPPGLEDDILEKFNKIYVIFHSPSTTPLLQPMGHLAILNFKNLYTNAQFERCLEMMKGINPLSLEEFWKSYYHIVCCLKNIDTLAMESERENLYPVV